MMIRKGESPPVEEVFDQAPSASALHGLEVLREAVAQALDRKRRLGQYAVVWEDGRVRILQPDDLPALPPSAPTAPSSDA
jgi:hypothetical protein